jgi:hypothetical protein
MVIRPITKSPDSMLQSPCSPAFPNVPVDDEFGKCPPLDHCGSERAR